MSLKGKKILVGLTGGIACYKIPILVRGLRKEGADVRVIMTDHATEFITPLTMETVSNNPVAVKMFSPNEYVSVRHIELAKWSDLTVIAPATANFIGKAASGISDDLLSTILCATAGPVLLAPAMNPNMWHNRITQRNLAILSKELGWMTIGPAEGEMAEDQWGVGRMTEPEDILKTIKHFFTAGSKKKALNGKHVLVTAGPCREPLDPVRFISNRSSGRMGYALAAATVEAGGACTLITGPTSLQPPTGVTVISVETTAEMQKAVVKAFPKTDILIMAAAPADFRPAKRRAEKIKKNDGLNSLPLEPTPDILKSLIGRKKKGQRIIGFAVETENGPANARRKLVEKQLDMIVLNNPNDKGAAFDHETNQVTVFVPGKRQIRWELMSKSELSSKLLDYIANLP